MVKKTKENKALKMAEVIAGFIIAKKNEIIEAHLVSKKHKTTGEGVLEITVLIRKERI